MRDIRAILEGIVSQSKPMGSGSAAFRHSSSSGAKGPEHGIDVGAHRNYDHEVRAKNKSLDDAKKREQTVEKRNREAEQRQKETAKMAKEETVTEAKKFVFDKPQSHMVKAYDKRDTSDLHDMHKRWSADHSKPKNNPETSEKLLAVHHVLKSRGENVGELPKHKNLGLTMHEETVNEIFGFGKKKSEPEQSLHNKDLPRHPDNNKAKEWMTSRLNHALKHAPDKAHLLFSPASGDYMPLNVHVGSSWKKEHEDHYRELKKKHPDLVQKAKKDMETNGPYSQSRVGDHQDYHGVKLREETNSEKRMTIKNVARPNDAAPTSEKSTLAKTGEIKTKIVEEKPTMSMPNFGLSQSLINAARQIVEKKQEDDGVDAKKMTGGNTVVDTDPETNDKVEDADSKPAKKKSHTVPKTDKEKKLAALASPKDKITHKDVMVGRGVVRKEEVELSAEEIARIEAIAAQLDEAKPTMVSSPIRGANQDQSGFGTKGSTADYTISDSKKMKEELSSKEKMKRGMYNKEEVELEEASMSSGQKTAYRMGMTHGAKGAKKIDASKSFGPHADYYHRGYTQGKDSEEWHEKQRARKEEVELEEGRGRPRKNPLPPGKQAEEGDDTHKHPMQQLEKIAHSVEGNEPHFEHKDGSKTKVGKNLARHMVVTHNSMKTTQEKNNFADKLHANRDSMRSEMGKHF